LPLTCPFSSHLTFGGLFFFESLIRSPHHSPALSLAKTPPVAVFFFFFFLFLTPLPPTGRLSSALDFAPAHLFLFSGSVRFLASPPSGLLLFAPTFQGIGRQKMAFSGDVLILPPFAGPF